MVKRRTPEGQRQQLLERQEQERQRWVKREWVKERLRVPDELPAPDPVVVDGFIDFLFSIDDKVCRPPRQAAKLLAFVVQLHQARGGPRPFPTRPQVAKHLGMSVPTVDAVLNLHIAEGNLSVDTRYRDGNIEQRRASAIKERYIIPSDVLIHVYSYTPDRPDLLPRRRESDRE